MEYRHHITWNASGSIVMVVFYYVKLVGWLLRARVIDGTGAPVEVQEILMFLPSLTDTNSFCPVLIVILGFAVITTYE